MKIAPYVMVIEPETGFRWLLEDLLSDQVTLAVYEQEADALRDLGDESRKLPDVVLCAAPLPGSKRSVLQRIRQSERTAKVPIVAYSHLTGLVERAQASEHGASEYLVRPVEPQLLEQVVRHWSGRLHQRSGQSRGGRSS